MDLEQLAYFFEYELADGLPESVYDDLRRVAAGWSESWVTSERPSLTYWSAPHFVQICDQRQAGQAGTYTFEDTLADLYLACIDRPTTAAAIRRKLGLRLSAQAVEEVFSEFRQRGLMFLDGQFALALAVPSIRGR
jgi:hypothetical protein